MKHLLEFSWKGIAYIKSLPMLIMNNTEILYFSDIYIAFLGTLTRVQIQKELFQGILISIFSRNFDPLCEEVSIRYHRLDNLLV